MKNKNTIAYLVIAFAFFPFYAGAQTVASTSPVSEAQVFTACSQASIEVRDNAIGSARTSYNVAMSAALSARKDAEKEAVALTDPAQKKEAIRIAVEAYKKAVTNAQDNLTAARKDAWDTFETNTNNCREASKESHKGTTSDVNAAPAFKQEPEASKPEGKTFRESFLEQIDSIKNFFMK